MFGDALIELLFTVFKNCLKCGVFPRDWKKGNIVPVFKKGEKQNLNIYIYIYIYIKLKQGGIKDKLLCPLIDFLKNSQQIVVLNGQFSSWTKVNVAVPQGSVSGLLLFLIYINDLPNDLQSNPKIFADDISLFSAVQDIITNTVSLSHDLSKISEWTVQ